jgi:hypothetical protein
LSLDDLFALLIVFLFVVLPLLNRMQQRGRTGTAPGAPQRPRPGQPQPRQPGSAPATGGSATRPDRPTGREEAGDAYDDLTRRLEEARRRVREAMGSQGELSTGPQPSAPAVPAPSAPRRTIASAGIPSGRAGGPARPTPPAPAAAPPRREPRRAVTAPDAVRRTGPRKPGFAEATPAIEVDRSGGRARTRTGRERLERAQVSARRLVALDPESIRKGVLWHMVLSEASAYGRGRTPSPRLLR